MRLTDPAHPANRILTLAIGALGVVLPTVFYLEHVVNTVRDAHAYDVQAAEVEAARDAAWMEIDQLTRSQLEAMTEELANLRTEIATSMTALHHLEDEIARDKGEMMFALGSHAGQHSHLENLLDRLERVLPLEPEAQHESIGFFRTRPGGDLPCWTCPEGKPGCLICHGPPKGPVP